MSLSSKRDSTDEFLRKIYIAEVSLKLQDQLGLAMLKYQRSRLNGLQFARYSGMTFDLSPKPTSFNSSPDRCKTSPTRGLSWPERSKRAVISDSHRVQLTLTTSRNRLRPDSDAPSRAKAASLSWNGSYQVPDSSPRLNLHMANQHYHTPFISETRTHGSFSSISRSPDKENDPGPPQHSFQNLSSIEKSSRRLSPKQARLRREYFDNSPTSARIGRSTPTDFLPSTPPNKHVPLPLLTPDLGTPNQHFNFDDFVNLTPSPARPACVTRATMLATNNLVFEFDAVRRNIEGISVKLRSSTTPS